MCSLAALARIAMLPTYCNVDGYFVETMNVDPWEGRAHHAVYCEGLRLLLRPSRGGRSTLRCLHQFALS
jgi:hypothetical protein